MRPPFAKLLKHGPVLVGGPYGTELQARGLAVGESADAWNVLRPTDVEAVARSYVDAGANVLLTNTFQANEACLDPHGLGELMGEINFAAVEIARTAVGRNGFVFGSVGPIHTTRSLNEILGWSNQAEALLDSGADGIVMETFTDVDMLERALEDTTFLDGPIIASLTLHADVSLVDAAARLRAAGAAGIGLNCMTPDEMLPLCKTLRKATRLPLWMKPSAGLPRNEDGRLVYDMTPEEFADGAMALVAAGADFIGGCCGAGPAHIAALAARLHRRR